MGSCCCASVNNVSLRFNPPDKQSFQTGEKLSGVIDFYNTDPTPMRYKTVTVTFFGRSVYFVLRISGRSATYDKHVQPFFSERLFFLGNDENQEGVLNPGKHEWPFSFVLPKYLPPSIERIRCVGQSIEYGVFVEVSRPELCRSNIKKEFPIHIRNCWQTMLGTQIENQKVNRNSVSLRGYIEKNAVTAGSVVTVYFEVNNPEGSTIRYISGALIQHRTVFDVSDQESNTIIKKEIKENEKLKENALNDKMDFILPNTLPATCLYQPPDWRIGQQIEINYQLHVELHLYGAFTNVEIELPVTIFGASETPIDERSSNELVAAISQ